MLPLLGATIPGADTVTMCPTSAPHVLSMSLEYNQRIYSIVDSHFVAYLA